MFVQWVCTGCTLLNDECLARHAMGALLGHTLEGESGRLWNMSDPNNEPGTLGADHQRAERQAFTQNLLRWQSEAPGFGAGVAPEAAQTLASADAPPGQSLSEIIRRASARAQHWDEQRLSAAAGTLRASGGARFEMAAFFSQVAIMNVISHAIEERIIAERRHCEVYAGFQRLALVRPQLRRYRELAEVARYVYLFGMDDTEGDPEIRTLGPRSTLRFDIRPELQTGLEHFWFVVVDDPRLPTALLAQHTSGDLWSPRQANRSFTGIWTFDPTLVAQIIAVLRHAARILHYRNPLL